MRRVVLLTALLAIAHPAAATAQPDGRALYLEGCAGCHGDDARGTPGQAPSLRRAGAQATDFYLSTGRMPLADPHDEPVRSPPAYTSRERKALIAYLGSLGGPPVPPVDPGAVRSPLSSSPPQAPSATRVPSATVAKQSPARSVMARLLSGRDTSVQQLGTRVHAPAVSGRGPRAPSQGGSPA